MKSIFTQIKTQRMTQNCDHNTDTLLNCVQHEDALVSAETWNCDLISIINKCFFFTAVD